MKRNPSIYTGISKSYQPSVASTVLPFTSNGVLYRIDSDVRLIKFVHDYGLSSDAAAVYLQSLQVASNEEFDNVKLDDLRRVAVPRQVNNITDMYMYSKYLAAKRDDAGLRLKRYGEITEYLSDTSDTSDKSD